MSSKIILYIVILTSFLVSLYLAATQSIRLDEAQSIWFATKPVDTLLHIMGQDVNTPLYILILHFWIQILGTKILIVRLLSLIFFMLSIPVLFKFTEESSNIEVAITTVCLYCLSPFIVWYTAEARTYTLLILATTLSHLYFGRLLRTKLSEGKLGFLLSSILGLYTHYFFIFFLFTQTLYFIFNIVFKEIKNYGFNLLHLFKTIGNRKVLSFAGLVLLSLLSLSPWLAYVISLGSASNMKPMIARPTSYNLFQTFVNFIFGFQSSSLQNVLISLWPLVIVFIFLVFTIKRNTQINNLGYISIISFLPVLIMFLLSFIQPIFLSRYMIFVTPTLFLLLAWLIINLARRVTSLVVLSIFLVIFSFLMFQSVSADSPIKEDYVDTAHYLSQKATPQDVIAVSSPFTIYPIEYSYTGRTRIDTIPLWERYETGSIPPFSIDNLKKQLAKYKERYNNLYVVLSYDQGYQKQIQNYLDKNYKREDLRKFSEGIELRVYKLRYP